MIKEAALDITKTMCGDLRLIAAHEQNMKLIWGAAL